MKFNKKKYMKKYYKDYYQKNKKRIQARRIQRLKERFGLEIGLGNLTISKINDV